MTTLSARSISVQFGFGASQHAAVADVSVDIHDGECVGIVGESGSGKTTLARVLVGLQKPSTGEVLLDGTRVVDAAGSHFSPRARRQVQTVFQDPYDSLNPQMRAVDSVAEAERFWNGGSSSSARTQAYRLLEDVGIPKNQADSYPRQLSGGQRQRVCIVRALAPKPAFLVADEPTSSIDQSAQAQLMNMFRSLLATNDLGVVFISHDLALVGYLSTRVLVMRAGRVVEEGLTGDILLRPRHPYTRTLLASQPGRRRASQGSLFDAGQPDPGIS